MVKHPAGIGRVSQVLWNRVELEIADGNERSFIEVQYDELEPIPVTKEVLEKCDLVKHRRFYYANVFYSKTGKFVINQLRDNIEISFAVNSTPGIISDKNLNLHQLQNMYFVLMNEELHIDM